MSTNARLGHGTKLQRGNNDGPAETFTDLTELQSIDGPGGQRDAVEVTDMDSVDGFREYIAGLADSGELSFDVFYNPNDPIHAILLDDFNNSTINNYQIVWPFAGNPTLGLGGFIQTFSTNTPIDAPVTASVSIKITGKVTLS